MAHHIPRKRFGQHFLVDSQIIEPLVRCIDPRPEDTLLEIGPGLGALTHPLLAHCERLIVIEIDRDLAARLRKRPELEVIESDVLNIDFAALAASMKRKLRLVGNLPYNISTPILFHLLPAAAQIADQHFMLQKEVVDRMVAQPGSKDYGRLSVMLQWRYHMNLVLDVPPESFAPPPRVNSAVVRMVPRQKPEAVEQELLREMVTVAFSQRRKILRHTLGVWLQSRGVSIQFDLQRRAEEVPVQDYLKLAQFCSASHSFVS
ncbi:MAG: 16S rRNA (adenine(1518)-N(6)/adenine(1519)-N(6))-dimethyltransferase RsmA [Burkholderiales bacterium]